MYNFCTLHEKAGVSGFSLFLLLIAVHFCGLLQCQAATVLIHFGGCSSTQYGDGKCVARNSCFFPNVATLRKEQCQSQSRRDLVCCPNNINAAAAAEDVIESTTQRRRTTTTTESTTRTTTTTTTARTIATSTALSAADMLPRAPECGIELGNKIYGGVTTNILEFPWTVLLQYTTTGRVEHNCGGSFIAQRWVLTAAHCVLPQFFGGLNLTAVRLGEWDQRTDPDCISYNGKRDCIEPHIDVLIDRILPHDDFDTIGLGRDIALLRLERPIDWHQYRHITAICLPIEQHTRNDRLNDVTVDIAGWGRTEHNNERSMVKRKAQLRVWSLETCKPKYAVHKRELDDTQMCASGGHGVDSCRGDSGGPLMAIDNTKSNYYYLAGIVSYGKIACGRNDFPGVYTRVGAFIDWIESTIRENV